MSRGALTFENLERRPKVGLIKANSQGIFVDPHELPCADASSVFDLELKKRLDTERKSLNDFIVQLAANRDMAADAGVSARKAELDKFPADLRGLALEVLEAAEAGVLEE